MVIPTLRESKAQTSAEYLFSSQSPFRQLPVASLHDRCFAQNKKYNCSDHFRFLKDEEGKFLGNT